MEFHDALDIQLNHMYPTDMQFREDLKAFIDHRPLEAFNARTRSAVSGGDSLQRGRSRNARQDQPTFAVAQRPGYAD